MSSQFTVEIGNSEGQSFRMILDVPFVYSSDGSWRTLDKGFIRYNSGYCRQFGSVGTYDTRHLRLVNYENKWGIQLNDVRDFWGANDQGSGLVLQPWVISFKGEVISWVKID